MESLIGLRGVEHSFDGGRVAALRGVDLDVARGDCAAIVGPSGCGKTTMIYLMCGLDRPSGGVVAWRGRERLDAAEWTRLRGSEIGIVFQDFNLLPVLSAVENVELAMLGGRLGARERRVRAEELLDRVGLKTRRDHRPSELSGGERQRVAIARSLANHPVVLLADEPTGNLDSASAATVLELLLALHRDDGLSLVIVTHDPAIAARCARRIRLADGRVAGES